MATRSTIALEFADGTVEQVYCHWDGYLAHNGLMLLEHYSNPFILRAPVSTPTSLIIWMPMSLRF